MNWRGRQKISNLYCNIETQYSLTTKVSITEWLKMDTKRVVASRQYVDMACIEVSVDYMALRI